MLEELSDYGLSEKEIKIFLSSQKLGPVTANQLAVDSGVIRSTTYEILESLRQKGIISSFEKDNKLYFESISPKQLLALIQDKARKIERIIPSLESLRAKDITRPTSQVFIGKKGIQAVLEEILEKKISYWAYANSDLFEKFQYYFPNFIKRKIELKIFSRVIQEKTTITIKDRAEGKKGFREMRFSKEKLKASAFIYGDKVLFLDIANDELVGVLITDKNIADLQRQVFEIMWKDSK